MISLKDTPSLSDHFSVTDEELERLQERLFLLQRRSFDKEIAHIFIIEGWSSSGKGELLKTLTVRLDPKKFKVHSPDLQTSEDNAFPFLWKFWQILPRFGESLFYLNSYYGKMIYLLAKKKIKKKEYEENLKYILHMEAMLSLEKVRFHKFFFHLNPKEQKRRFSESKKENRNWELSAYDKDQFKHYSAYRRLFKECLSDSHTEFSPWTIIEADDLDKAKTKLLLSLIESLESILETDSALELGLLKNGAANI
ncbi:polyphosphate kinase [Leptospira ilyithenensis]|uniref:Polyphosphate kinase n=1 Tax=Leptospira ilyithenensis TaxID=2484901 RepID=A0A4R9LTM6_9LEPT|nr:polyphosphate kinase [Leptospira ilyithenensis]TGN13999.1 polyphosphate kinase [Leptospira ilyithenensis]